MPRAAGLVPKLTALEQEFASEKRFFEKFGENFLISIF
jgi:hypothetical protein